MLLRRIAALSVFGLFSLCAYSQIQTPQMPGSGGFQPVTIPTPQPATMPRYDNFGSSTPMPNTNGQVKMGATTEDIIRQNNMQRSNTPKPYDKDIQRQAQSHKEYEEALADVHEAFGKPRISYSLPSHRNDPGAGSYQKAYNELNAMLSGQKSISLKRAVFLVENAYFDNQMSYEAYNKRIQSYAQFCRLKLKEEKADTNDNIVKNNLLFRLMSDTLTVIDPVTKKKITHYPVHYDFEDFYGKEDWTKMFVTKLMSTNYGQCHSMPLLFGIIAEEIGAKAYLSTSPSHLFIKYKNDNEWKNVELTNGHMTTDAYLIGSGFIKSAALRNRLYLDTLSPNQAIAMLMQDLAKGYYVKYGFDDFVLQCTNAGLKYYSNDAYGMAIKSDYNTVLFQYVVSQMGNRTPQEVLSIPEARKLHVQMLAMYDTLDNSGYAQMPEEAYEEWLRSIDIEKRKQEYELFLQYQKTHKSTINLNERTQK